MKANFRLGGFIQTPILIVIVAGALLAGGGGATYWGYRNVSDTIATAEQLSIDGNHTDAIARLEDANNNWLVRIVGIKEDVISGSLSEFNKRVEDRSVYDSALTKIEEKDFQAAIDLLIGIPEGSFYYQNSQLKIAQLEKALLEGELEIERIAKEAAERRVVTEKAAKEEQQRQTAIQTQRADEEEKAKYIELARTNPAIKALIAGELKFYIEPLPYYAGDGVSDTIDGVADIIDGWTLYGADIKHVSSPSDADITVSWIRDYGSHTLGESIFRAHLKVGLGQTNCLGDWRAFDKSTVGKIFVHEFGHSIGYGHTNDSNNIMYPELVRRFDVEQEIEDVIAAGWYLALPLCESGEYFYSFDTGDVYDGFNLFVLPPGTSASEASAGTGQYYPGCSAEEMSRFSEYCTVGYGSTIYIENNNLYTAIRIDGEITNLDQPSTPDFLWPEDAYQYDDAEINKIWDLFH